MSLESHLESGLRSSAAWIDGLDLLLAQWQSLELRNMGWIQPPPRECTRINFNPALTLNWSMKPEWLLYCAEQAKAQHLTQDQIAWSAPKTWLIRQHGTDAHFRKIEWGPQQVSLTDNRPQQRHVINVNLKVSPWKNELFHYITKSQNIKHIESRHFSLALHSLFALAIVELRDQLQQLQVSPIDSGHAAWLAIQDFLPEHLNEDIDRRRLATLVQVHPSHISRIFKRFSEQGFSNYLRQLRVKRATEYLKSDQLNLDEIATACGLGDATYLIRCFKQVHGCTPGAYRAEHAFI